MCLHSQVCRASTPNRALKPPAWITQVLGLPSCVLGRTSQGISAGCPINTLPSSIPAAPCKPRNSQLPWNRPATIAGLLHPTSTAPFMACCQAILPFLPLQTKQRLFTEEDPPFSARRAACQAPGHTWAPLVGCKCPSMLSCLPADEGSKASVSPALVSLRSRELSPATWGGNRMQGS